MRSPPIHQSFVSASECVVNENDVDTSLFGILEKSQRLAIIPADRIHQNCFEWHRGISGLYKGTRGASQPYAPKYHVAPEMRRLDMQRGIYDHGYEKNPTAQKLSGLINGNYVGSKQMNGVFPYVIDLEGNIIIGKRNGNGTEGKATPHPTLIGGKDPQVQVAGMLEIRGGKIYKYDNQSRHYKPNIKSMSVANDSFSRLPGKIFHKNFKEAPTQ